MFLDDKIYQAFLEEVQSLETFRASHTSLYRDTPIELVEDPDTLRLMEALAFFAARSRLQGINKIAQIHQLLFRQYFSFLVNPLPAMGLVQLQPSLRIPEQVILPAESELVCNTYDGRKATFQTLDSVTISSLFFHQFNFYRRLQGGWRLEITYQSPHVCSDELETVRFYINHLNSFFGSIRVYFALNRSLETVTVHYDESKVKNAKGTPCSFHFGSSTQRKIFNHPLEKIRSQLHFPEQEMFMTIDIPSIQKKWQSITICFDLNEKWPENLTLTKDSLALYVIPIVNLKLDRADPIECNGMKDGYPLLHPNPIHQFKLHTVLSASEVLPSGMRPLRPGILDTRGSAYEIDFFDEQIFLELPNAFQQPRTVSVEALWTQLWFSDYIDQEFKIRFAEEQFSGLKLQLLQQMRSHENTIVANDPKFLIRVLALKNQNKLNVSELLFLMNSLKKIDHGYFKFIPALIKNLEVFQQNNRMGLGPTVCYQFQLKEWDGKNWELVIFFFKKLNNFLNCWLSNFHVETKVFFPYVKTPVTFKGETDDELSILARDFYLP
ncbi:MAG TPA: type VI secretion system baseplate subunit TssF [Rhabdochlamydiaceae bacterium]|nr:type VI secretion system baseplate subunit TssF [Rhabdochlamydiaceae bacterium]